MAKLEKPGGSTTELSATEFRNSDFELVSDFEIWISDFGRHPVDKTRNSNLETRNKSEWRNWKNQAARPLNCLQLSFEIRISSLFRISRFGFRILGGTRWIKLEIR